MYIIGVLIYIRFGGTIKHLAENVNCHLTFFLITYTGKPEKVFFCHLKVFDAEMTYFTFKEHHVLSENIMRMFLQESKTTDRMSLGR